MESGRAALRFTFAIVVHGIGTGLIGAFIAMLIRTVQEVGYGNSHHGFLAIALATPPWRRLACTSVGGIFGAFSWYWLRGAKPSIVGVESSLQGKKMPPVVTIVNGMIQDIVVALGGSFGREAAPREIAAMWGGSLADMLGCDEEDRQLLVACGTGAGLAAVYAVPISGTLYTLEHVLKWKCSVKIVIASVATSVIATIVGSIQVEQKPLYHMPKFSYAWPSLQMLLWAAIIGPLAGMAAMMFRRIIKWVEKFKPHHRFPVDFEKVLTGHTVKVDGRWGKVTDKSDAGISVLFVGDAKDQSFDKEAWALAKPEGERDWRILFSMPTVFLVLGVTSEKMPSLLGNGRALASVAIARARSPFFFSCLLILKVFLTAGSIGAGAAGGTLTPSVAIGATFGAVIGEEFQHRTPNLAPRDDAPMSVISAASFLAVAMMSPVTGLWLLVEFSGQGVDRADLVAMLRGDFSGIVRSKLAAGMLVPMILAVIGGQLAIGGWNKAWEIIKPRIPRRLSRHTPSRKVTNRILSHDLDLPEHDDEDGHLHLSTNEEQGLFICFRAGLVSGTCATVLLGTALHVCPEKVAHVSRWGLPLAFAAGTIGWLVITKKERSSYTSLLPSGEDTGAVESQESTWSHCSTGSYRQDFRHSFYGGVFAVALAVLGAVVPIVPWELRMWSYHAEKDALCGIMASVIGCVALSACVKIFVEPHPLHAISAEGVVKQQSLICLACGVAAAIGWCLGQADWLTDFFACHAE